LSFWFAWFVWFLSFLGPTQPNKQNKPNQTNRPDLLFHEMGGKEHVLTPVPAKHDFVTSGELVDAVEDLIPGVLRHQGDERIQANDCLFVQMTKNGGCQRIVLGTLPY
jgi:hypothetical protein